METLQTHPLNTVLAAHPQQLWYAMRTVGSNTYKTICRQLDAANIEYFLPVREVVRKIGGKVIRDKVPVVGGLIFCHDVEPKILEECERSGNRLQFIIQRGKRITDRLVIPEKQMNNFIKAATSAYTVTYLSADEINKARGKRVRIHGGMLDGVEGRLTKKRGKKQTLIVELEDLMTISVVFAPEVIEVLE